MSHPLILVVEDEAAIAELLAINLRHEGFEVLTARSAEQGQSMVDERIPALAVVDWMLPGRTGIELLRHWRTNARTRSLPVIMLTARAEEAERVQGLDLGADDYLAKPFSVRELLARIRSVLRRRQPDLAQQTQVVGGLTLHPLTRQAKAGPISLKLGPKDFRLLQVLMAQPDRVFTRAQLLDKVWGDHVEVEDRTVDAQIKRLRDALSPAQAQGCIQTIRSVGYRLDSVAASSIPAGSGLP